MTADMTQDFPSWAGEMRPTVSDLDVLLIKMHKFMLHQLEPVILSFLWSLRVRFRSRCVFAFLFDTTAE